MGLEIPRKKLLPLGTHVGIVGDDCPPSEDWNHGKVALGTLKEYLVVERHHNLNCGNDDLVWDYAAIVWVSSLVEAIGHDLSKPYGTKSTFTGQDLMLLQRHPSYAWDNNDPNVHVFGIVEQFGGMLLRHEWLPKVVWLAGHATMMVEESNAPSEMAKLFRAREEK